MKLRIKNFGLSYVGDPSGSDLYIDGIAATLTIVSGPGSTALMDGIIGANWTPPATGGVVRIDWPVVYMDGKPVRYDQRFRIRAKMAGILSIVYLDEA